jgi:mRNA interferase RelE/StbE
LQKKASISWQLKFSPLALKDLRKLDHETNRLILTYLYEKVGTPEDPRRFGKPLTGNLKAFWRYRVNDYRIICEIRDDQFQVLAIHVAHRSKVYKSINFLK